MRLETKRWLAKEWLIFLIAVLGTLFWREKHLLKEIEKTQRILNHYELRLSNGLLKETDFIEALMEPYGGDLLGSSMNCLPGYRAPASTVLNRLGMH